METFRISFTVIFFLNYIWIIHLTDVNTDVFWIIYVSLCFWLNPWNGILKFLDVRYTLKEKLSVSFFVFLMSTKRMHAQINLYYCSRRELCYFTRESNSSLIFNFRHILLLLLQYFPILPVSESSENGICFCSCFCCWSVRKSELLGKEKVLFICTVI